MMDKNPQALAQAFKKCKGKIAKIQELGIKPDMPEDEIEAIIEKLSVAKAEEDGSKMEDHVQGQRWYVEGLVKFSGMTTQEQLDFEYEECFANTATEDEMLKSLEALSSKAA